MQTYTDLQETLLQLFVEIDLHLPKPLRTLACMVLHSVAKFRFWQTCILTNGLRFLFNFLKGFFYPLIDYQHPSLCRNDQVCGAFAVFPIYIEVGFWDVKIHFPTPTTMSTLARNKNHSGEIPPPVPAC